MQPWQQRIVDEAKDLEGKIERLTAYVDANRRTAPIRDIALLMEQRNHMKQYLMVLQKRIARFARTSQGQ